MSMKKKRAAIRVEETSPGCISITCERSGLPLTRTNEHGMFCDAKPCQCETDSKAVMKSLASLLESFKRIMP